MSRMPARPAVISAVDRSRLDPQWPHEQVAAQLERAWRAGDLVAGEPLTAKAISTAHEVSIGTAHRVMTLLNEWGVLHVGRGRPSVVAAAPADQASDKQAPERPAAGGRADGSGVPGSTTAVHRHADAQKRAESVKVDDRPAAQTPAPSAVDDATTSCGRVAVMLELLHLGTRVRTMRAHLDLDDIGAAERLLHDAVRRLGADVTQIGDYELEVRLTGEDEPRAIVVAAA